MTYEPSWKKLTFPNSKCLRSCKGSCEIMCLTVVLTAAFFSSIARLNCRSNSAGTPNCRLAFKLVSTLCRSLPLSELLGSCALKGRDSSQSSMATSKSEIPPPSIFT
ncbi:hypothetical protein PFLmoz3_00779 [Pseudomonas fluorescens]|uniref:Uncharacterized protein n=1 Tax=Pseudomonas fluorescens TaxID=294 RepID=A0A120G912_PSEFL|nr:hypothetical protein PFLmoz3_00779 [Pseudomonas fluorescens]